MLECTFFLAKVGYYIKVKHLVQREYIYLFVLKIIFKDFKILRYLKFFDTSFLKKIYL